MKDMSSKEHFNLAYKLYNPRWFDSNEQSGK